MRQWSSSTKMDYLDPKKKQAHKARLLIGYVLFGIAIAFATTILVYLANGYYIDRNTGEVIQNGLVYLDSKPGGAKITLNGVLQRGRTDARLVIPSGTYNFGLSKDGYRNWSRSLTLEGGSLRSLTYARLIPESLETSLGSTLRTLPANSSQSIDRKWVVVSYIEEPLKLDLLDTSLPDVAPVNMTIPSTVVTKGDDGVLKVIEWAEDNRYFLASYENSVSTDYLLIDRENPAQTINVGNALGNNKVKISLQDRKRDSFFAYDSQTKSLSIATLSSGISPSPLLTNVIEYKTFGADWVIYITSSTESGYVEARFMREDKDILIKKLREDKNYLLELSRIGTAPIMAIGSPVENRVVVYNDPEDYLNHNSNSAIPVATTVLRVETPLGISISDDSSVVMAWGAKNFASHEFNADRSYNFSVGEELNLNQNVRWLDGQHFLFSGMGVQNIMDFDGSNRYSLVSSTNVFGGFFSKDFKLLYALNPPILNEKGVVVTQPQLTITNMLVPADR